ncbi:MAG: hypothetical protein FJ116_07860, partial [Deltaproteobacteria bacterium]|nr:hypothetical protein [Deltaproteobacteria bacterium]
MKFNYRIALISLCLLQSVASAKNYIVLFKQAETIISSMEHGAFQTLLQSSNQKNIDELKKWMEDRSLRSEVKDLWLVRGAALSLEENAAKKLAQEAWVKGLFEDKVRRLISPSPNLIVANTQKELGDEVWG